MFKKIHIHVADVFLLILVFGLASCINDSEDGIQVLTEEDLTSRAVVQIKTRNMANNRGFKLQDVETRIVSAKIYMYESASRRLYRIFSLGSENLDVIVPPSDGMEATYQMRDSVVVDKGTYDFFVLCNYGNYPSGSAIETEDYFKASSTTFIEGGITSTVPETGMPMSSRANEYLGVELKSRKDGKTNSLVFNLDRIYAKVTLSVGQLEFGLNDTLKTAEGKDSVVTYAKVDISSYWFTNLMKKSYDFRHIAKVENLADAPGYTDWIYKDEVNGNYHLGRTPWEMTPSQNAEDYYVVDPAFFEKTLPLDTSVTSKYYENYLGSYETGTENPQFSLFWRNYDEGTSKASVYILENTAYKDSQIWGYSPGVILYAAVDPIRFYAWDGSELIKVNAADYPWEKLYLYNKKFYYDLTSLSKAAPQLPISEDWGEYTDDELAVYNVKQLNNVQGTGVCFYYLRLKHLIDAPLMGAMKFGVVRNTYYNFTISNVKGIGVSRIMNKSTLNDEPYSYQDIKVEEE